jgi:hypothetical protein
MGLGLLMYAQRPSLEVAGAGRKTRARRREEPPAARELAEAFRAGAIEAAPALAQYARVQSAEDEWLVRLHPAEEELRITLTEPGRLQLSARTNGAGPGYHAFVVDLMDRAAERMRLSWSADSESGDETGYFEARDFEALQARMLAWLRAVARQVATSDDDVELSISMPIGTPTCETSTGIATPLGLLPMSWFRKTATLQGEQLAARGEDFFPWWERGFTATTFANLVRSILFTFPWHPPQNDEERALTDTALACLGARSGVRELASLSELEVAELRHLATLSPDEANAPRPAGIGMLRGLVRRRVFPSCSLALPGYYYDLDRTRDVEDDGEDDDQHAKVFWFGKRVIRIVCFEVRKDVELVPAEELLKQAGAGIDDVLETRSEPPTAESEGYTLALTEDSALFHAHAVVVRPGRLALLTITFGHRSEFDWAEDVVRSVRLFGDD